MIEEFHTLYDNATPIQRLKPQNTEEYKAFKVKAGKEIKLVGTSSHLDFLPHHTSYYPFFQSTSFFWLIPCDLPDGTVVGYVLRSMDKKGYRVATEAGTQLLFGWHSFTNFKKGDPIVVVESAKCQLYLSQFYPFVLACLTDGLSEEGYALVSSVTDKVVIGLNNDVEGRKQTIVMKKKLTDSRVRNTVCLPPLPAKDFGEFFSLCYSSEVVKTSLRMALAPFGVPLQ